MSELWTIITSPDPKIRNRSLDSFCKNAATPELLAEAEELDGCRRASQNLYERVRALFFLSAIHRFHLVGRADLRGRGHIPFKGFEKLLARRFEEAVSAFLEEQSSDGPSEGISSALASAYRSLAFQTLADQVRRSVRSVRGNQWMFRTGHSADYALRIRPEVLRRDEAGSLPDFARENTGPDGPQPQRVERHLFSGNGSTRVGPCIECFDRFVVAWDRLTQTSH